MSVEHEQNLLQLAESSYPEDPVFTDFQPLGIAPLHWEDTTIQVLYLLAETVSAQADLSPDKITIHGVTGNDLAWQSRLGALKSTLPSHVSVSADTLVVDPRVDAQDVCKRAFANFELGSINFEESSASFRSSAYPRLDRVIALANTCNKRQILITGHTDSSGNETWNQRLSLQRANAVGDYIVRGGVARERLRAAGVGSSAPIADDSTRYGRSLNRRINIAVTDAN
jgi:OOP family OmpA-OmpF porin